MISTNFFYITPYILTTVKNLGQIARSIVHRIMIAFGTQSKFRRENSGEMTNRDGKRVGENRRKEGREWRGKRDE